MSEDDLTKRVERLEAEIAALKRPADEALDHLRASNRMIARSLYHSFNRDERIRRATGVEPVVLYTIAALAIGVLLSLSAKLLGGVS